MKLDFRNRKHIVRELGRGTPARVLAEHYGVSKRHVNRIAGLSDLTIGQIGRRRKEYPQETRDLVVRLRRETSWGIRKLAFMLGRDYGVSATHHDVHRILIERGEMAREPKKGERHKYIRFERQHSNSMWQTDWKWLSDEECWLTAYLDDHSRFAVGAEKYTEATTDNTLELFHKSAGKYGYPLQVLTDHGTQYWAHNGISRYALELAALGVEHILGRIKKPTTTGKIERFWLTYVQESGPHNGLHGFLHYYNTVRQHQSLGYRTPVEIYKEGKVGHN